MKTSEFIKKVEKLGYEAVEGSDSVRVFRDNSSVAAVYKNKVNKLDTLWEEDVPHELFDILVEYARTPIEERKDVKKYYLKLPLNSSHCFSYLNYKAEDGIFSFMSPAESHSWKTKFTQNEINSLPSQEFVKTLIKEEVNEIIW